MITQRPSVFGPLTDTPRGVRVGAGVVAVVVGVLCVLRPFLSLAAVAVVAAVLLAGLVVGAVPRAVPPAAAVAVLLLVAVGALLAPDAVLTAAPFVLIAAGSATVVRGRRDRLAAVLGGAAAVGVGALALLWPDAAAYVLAVLFGLATVLAGLWLVVSGRPPRRRTWVVRTGAGLALTATIALLLATGAVLYAAPGFALTPPAAVPTGPGKLVAAQPLTGGLPAGARGWRILYTTERTDGSATVASGLVAVGGDPGVQRPVVAWAHGTTGYTGACAPSTLPDPLLGGPAGAGSALGAALDQGAALVATDYPGLSTPGPQPYLIGGGEGRAVLDAVRAAREVPGLALRNQVLIWGHSQGGHAALWAGELAPTYAPDLTVLGVAALAPATDLPAVAAGLDTVPGGSIFLSYLLRAYADTYPDVRLGDVLAPGGQVVVRGLAGRCLTAPAAVVSLASSTLFGPLLTRSPAGTALGTRLQENVPSARIAVPVLIAQGSADVLVRQATQDGYVRRLCGTGTAVDYRTYPDRDHAGLVAAGSPALPDLIAWSRARLSGGAAVSTC